MGFVKDSGIVGRPNLSGGEVADTLKMGPSNSLDCSSLYGYKNFLEQEFD
jgi:hypothetical protein